MLSIKQITKTRIYIRSRIYKIALWKVTQFGEVFRIFIKAIMENMKLWK